MTPHEERLLFRALAKILEMLYDEVEGRVYEYPDRSLLAELKTIAYESQSFLGKGADHA